MEYIRIDISHPTDDDPTLVVSEIGRDDRAEVRRVAHFPDGRIERASEETETRDTRLSVPALPTLDELRAHGASEWTARLITKEEFEDLWTEACARQTR